MCFNTRHNIAHKALNIQYIKKNTNQSTTITMYYVTTFVPKVQTYCRSIILYMFLQKMYCYIECGCITSSLWIMEYVAYNVLILPCQSVSTVLYSAIFALGPHVIHEDRGERHEDQGERYILLCADVIGVICRQIDLCDCSLR